MDSRLVEQGGIHETDGMRYFYADNSSLGGVIAGIAMNYVLDEKKPLFSLTRKETDDEVHVSCRGNQKLVAQGLRPWFCDENCCRRTRRIWRRT